MPAALRTLSPRIRAAAWIGVGGGLFVVAGAVALFVLLDLLHPPPGGWGSSFFVLVADLVFLGSALAMNGRHVLQNGQASRVLQGLTIAFALGVAVVALTSLP